MARTSKNRTQPCGTADARTRIRQAQAFLDVAQLVVDDSSDVATPGVGAATAVLAGIAAADAICCAKLGRRARGPSHAEAVALLERVEPGGRDMARDLRRLLRRKDDAHYGLHLLSTSDARDMVKHAGRLVERASSVL